MNPKFVGFLVAVWLLGAPARAQTSGVLYCLDPEERIAYLDTDQGPLACHLDAGQLGKLQASGLGSRWQVFTRGNDVSSALSLGSDANAQAGLTLVREQISQLDGGRYKEAYARWSSRSGRDPRLDTEKDFAYFPATWSKLWISENPAEIKLISSGPDQVQALVRGSHIRPAGVLSARCAGMPTQTLFLFTCARVNGKWMVARVQFIDDPDGTQWTGLNARRP